MKERKIGESGGREKGEKQEEEGKPERRGRRIFNLASAADGIWHPAGEDA